MRKKLLGIPATDLKTVRVLCARKVNDVACTGVIELPLSELYRVADQVCPVCRQAYRGAMAADPFAAVQRALGDLAGPDVKFAIEFVLPDEG